MIIIPSSCVMASPRQIDAVRRLAFLLIFITFLIYFILLFLQVIPPRFWYLSFIIFSFFVTIIACLTSKPSDHPPQVVDRVEELPLYEAWPRPPPSPSPSPSSCLDHTSTSYPSTSLFAVDDLETPPPAYKGYRHSGRQPPLVQFDHV